MVLGLIALAQVAVLPGLILFRLMRLHGGPVRTAAVVLFFSLLLNHLLVWPLAAVGLYTRPVLLGVLALEAAALLALHLRGVGAPGSAEPAGGVRRVLDDLGRTRSNFVLALKLALLGLVAFTLWLYTVRFGASFGTIFDEWDAVVSWNRWAIDWSRNGVPAATYHYPQLLPIAWSVVYVLTGSDLQFIPKALAAVFPLLAMLLVLQRGLDRGDYGFMLGAAATGFVLDGLIGANHMVGLADVPAAAFSFGAVYLLLVARDCQDRAETNRWVLAGGLVCAGAALCKQGGILIALAYPVLAWGLVLRPADRVDRRGARVVLASALLALGLAAPWYLHAEMDIRAGRDASEVTSVTEGAHRGRDYVERLEHALDLLATRFPYRATTGLLVLALLLLALRLPEHRWPLLAFAGPTFLIWALLFSYDMRNLAPAMPVIGAALGGGLVELAGRVGAAGARWHPGTRAREAAAVVVSCAVLAALAWRFPDGVLVQRQEALQRRVANPELNDLLYEYDRKAGLRGKVMTTYQILGYLPGLEDTYLADPFNDLDTFLAHEAGADYLLAPTARMAPPIRARVEAELRDGRYQLIFERYGYAFLKRVGERP